MRDQPGFGQAGVEVGHCNRRTFVKLIVGGLVVTAKATRVTHGPALWLCVPWLMQLWKADADRRKSCAWGVEGFDPRPLSAIEIMQGSACVVVNFACARDFPHLLDGHQHGKLVGRICCTVPLMEANSTPRRGIGKS